ncbi:hypothetical protein K503DRAFT_705190, partial [Rhizopogon vinicolor AM-OR11-026]
SSSLMLLKSLDKGELQAAFLVEESQRWRCPEGPSTDAALFALSNTCKCGPKRPPGHCTHKCSAFKQAKTNVKANNNGRWRCTRNANKASEMLTSSPTTPAASTSSTSAPTVPPSAQNTPQSTQSVREFAGNASLCSFDSSHPVCSLKLDAHADWNADTGATSHMTPHRHWLRNYAPKRVAIKLADNNIVYFKDMSLKSLKSLKFVSETPRTILVIVFRVVYTTFGL